jgi:serine/threonine protein kinase
MKLDKINIDKLKIYKMSDFTLEVSSDKRSGSFGEVTRGVITEGNIPIVLKKYKENIANTILKDDIFKEIIILQHLNQFPETKSVKLYGICLEFFPDKRSIYCYLVLEQLESDFHQISVKYKNNTAKNNGRYNYLQYKIIFYKCLKAINAIHSLGFVHNDIKLLNIMLNGTDIKFIDFGLSKYLGLNPLITQLNTYNTTDVIMAPDKRISFATDIFSIASTMVHLVSRLYIKLRCDYSNMKIYDKHNGDLLTSYLILDRTFGKDGYDLLCNLLNPNVNDRYCAKKALLHSYFDEIRQIEKDNNIEIDRTVVGLLGGGSITGLQNIAKYEPDNFEQKNLELCYFDELHLNYRDDIYPIKIINNTKDYHVLMNWLLQKFNYQSKPNYICYGLDTLLNCIIYTNNNFDYFSDKYRFEINPILNALYVNTFLNYSMFHTIFTDGSNDTINMLEGRVRIIDILDSFYNNISINISLYPISNHISHIYLQLLYNIKKLENSYEFSIHFYYKVSVMVIFWFIQPIPFPKQLTNWEIVVFCVIRILADILKITAIELIQNPLLPILVLDETLYTEMNEYYIQQLSSMDFKQYKNYNIYFNTEIP